MLDERRGYVLADGVMLVGMMSGVMFWRNVINLGLKVCGDVLADWGMIVESLKFKGEKEVRGMMFWRCGFLGR